MNWLASIVFALFLTMLANVVKDYRMETDYIETKKRIAMLEEQIVGNLGRTLTINQNINPDLMPIVEKYWFPINAKNGGENCYYWSEEKPCEKTVWPKVGIKNDR